MNLLETKFRNRYSFNWQLKSRSSERRTPLLVFHSFFDLPGPKAYLRGKQPECSHIVLKGIIDQIIRSEEKSKRDDRGDIILSFWLSFFPI